MSGGIIILLFALLPFVDASASKSRCKDAMPGLFAAKQPAVAPAPKSKKATQSQSPAGGGGASETSRALCSLLLRLLRLLWQRAAAAPHHHSPAHIVIEYWTGHRACGGFSRDPQRDDTCHRCLLAGERYCKKCKAMFSGATCPANHGELQR